MLTCLIRHTVILTINFMTIGLNSKYYTRNVLCDRSRYFILFLIWKIGLKSLIFCYCIKSSNKFSVYINSYIYLYTYVHKCLHTYIDTCIHMFTVLCYSHTYRGICEFYKTKHYDIYSDSNK